MILKLAFLLSIPLYIGLSFFLRNAEGPAPENTHLIAMVLAFVSVTNVVLAPLIARRGKTPQARFILKAAFYESVALYGFILSFITHDPNYSMYFGVPAFLLILIS